MKLPFGRKAKVERKLRELDLVRAQTRHLDRQAAVLSRSFYGAGNSNIATGEKSPGGLSASGVGTTYDHSEILQNVRTATYESPMARAMINRFADLGVGAGLKVRFEPKAEMLGITDKEAEDWGRKVSDFFNLYLSSKDCSYDGQMNGNQIMWQYAMWQQRDNDMYHRVHYTRDRDLLSPVQLQPMEPAQLSSRCYTSTEGFQEIQNILGVDNIWGKDGITYDSTGREVAFTFLVKQGDKYVERTVPKYGRRSKRQYMIHGFRPDYAGQKRGYSHYAHLLQELEELTTLSAAHIQKAINQSTFGFSITPSKDAPASGSIADGADQGAEAIVQEFFNRGGDVDSASVEELSGLVSSQIPEFTVRNPGSLWYTMLNRGEKLDPVDQTAPADKFGDFVVAAMTNYSASVGMPIEAVLMKFDASYSAARAILVLLWMILKMWKSEAKADFYDPWFTAVLSEEVGRGNIVAPGWQDPHMRAAWCNYRLIGQAMPSLDPLKEANAARVRSLELGHETLDDGALMYNSSDGRANRVQLQRERKELYAGVHGPQATEPDKKEEENEEIDD